MNLKRSILLYQFLAMLIVVGLVSACAKSSPTPNGNNLAGMTNTPNTGGGEGETGGIDSSGGDTLKSTKEQVSEALKDITSKLIIAKKRLSLSLSQYDVKDKSDNELFKKEYNSDDLALMTRFILKNKIDLTKVTADSKERRIDIRDIDFKNVIINIKEDDYCIGDKQHKAASATGTIDGGEICLSAKAFMTVAPEALQSQVITLALHEVAHLYGFNEDEASRIQKFLLENMFTHTPTDASIKRLETNLETLYYATTALLSSVARFDSDVEVCNNLGNINRSIIETLNIHTIDKTIKLNRTWDRDFFVTYLEAQNAMRYCGLNTKSYTSEVDKVETLQKKNLAKSLNFIFQGISQYMMQAKYYLDPRVIDTVPLHYQLSVYLLQYFGTEFSLSGNETVSDPKFMVNGSKNIICAFQNVNWLKDSKATGIQPMLIYKESDDGRGLYSYVNYHLGNRDMGEVMLRQGQGNNSIEVAIMEKDITDAEIISGIGFLGGDDVLIKETGLRKRSVIPMGLLYPDFANNLEIKYTSPKDKETYLIRCEVSKTPYNLSKNFNLEWEYLKKNK